LAEQDGHLPGGVIGDGSANGGTNPGDIPLVPGGVNGGG